MSTALRALIAIPPLSLLTWSSYVSYQRQKLPNRKTFLPGSMDEFIMDSLQTGDIVLFSRNCLMMQPIPSSICALTKKLLGMEYDHCGMIYVSRHGDTFVLEHTFRGFQCRPYSARILCSKSLEITIRHLEIERTPEMQQVVEDYIQQQYKLASKGAPKSSEFHFTQFTGLVNQNSDHMSWKTPIHPSTAMITHLYQKMGILSNESLTPNNSTPKDYHPQNTTLSLLNGAKFSPPTPIRLL